MKLDMSSSFRLLPNVAKPPDGAGFIFAANEPDETGLRDAAAFSVVVGLVNERTLQYMEHGMPLEMAKLRAKQSLESDLTNEQTALFGMIETAILPFVTRLAEISHEQVQMGNA